MKRFVFVLSLLLFAGMNLLQAQGVQVSGNVTSADDGSALPGVSAVSYTHLTLPTITE